jgi:hypothetical protein
MKSFQLFFSLSLLLLPFFFSGGDKSYLNFIISLSLFPFARPFGCCLFQYKAEAALFLAASEIKYAETMKNWLHINIVSINMTLLCFNQIFFLNFFPLTRLFRC